MGHLHELSLVRSHFGNCIYKHSAIVILRDGDVVIWDKRINMAAISVLMSVSSTLNCSFVCMQISNPKVINNLDGANNGVQSEVRGAAPNNAYLGRNCHPRDGFCSLQGECL